MIGHVTAGYFRSGLPYNRFGHGPRPLVIFQGLVFENKPQSGPATRMYNFLREDTTGYSVLRKPGLPQGYRVRDMADDYAATIREEFDHSASGKQFERDALAFLREDRR